MKAMVLAAGRGERMMPLTKDTPKPLLVVNGLCLIEHVLVNLQKAGVREAVVNVSYFAEKIMEKLGDGSRYGVRITYSHECDGLLGTGGGIYKALPLLGPDPFLLVSSDIWSDYSFERLVQRALLNDAHLVMVPNPDFHPDGDFGLDRQGFLTLGPPKLTYANIGMLHPRLFEKVSSKAFSLAPLLVESIKRHGVTGELYQGVWSNVGTPKMLKDLVKE